MIRYRLYVFLATIPFAPSLSCAQVLRIVSPPGYMGDGFARELVAMPPGVNGEGGRIAIGRYQAFSPNEFPGQGHVFIFEAATGALLRTVSSPHPTVTGSFGLHLAASTDTNRDGSSDLIVSAHTEGFADPPSGGGRAYQISGSTGDAIFEYPPMRAIVGFSENGVASAPDVDGDGIDDPVVTSHNESTRGRVHVYSGRTGELIRLLTPAAGTSGNDFGYAAAGSPDMDGDGRGEIIVASNREFVVVGGTDRGVIYVFSGATGQPLLRVPLVSAYSVAAAPDVNGDHIPDFLGGTLFGTPPELPGVVGFVRVFSGASGDVLLTLTNPLPQYGQMRIGPAISGTPDLNHDGHGDILVGAANLPSPQHPPPQSVGAVFVFSGANGQLLRTLRAPIQRLDAAFGYCVTTLPDTNGDGVPELLIGAGGERIDPLPIGAAYVFFSCPADWNADGLATSADFFAFLEAFLTLSDQADFNHDGFTNSQDFFDYLSAFFQGCE